MQVNAKFEALCTYQNHLEIGKFLSDTLIDLLALFPFRKSRRFLLDLPKQGLRKKKECVERRGGGEGWGEPDRHPSQK